MAQLSLTAQANVLAAGGASWSLRVQSALLRQAAVVYAENVPGTLRGAYVRQVTGNPAGVANAWTPVVLSQVNAAAYTNVSQDATFTQAQVADAEVQSTVASLWNFFAGV